MPRRKKWLQGLEIAISCFFIILRYKKLFSFAGTFKNTRKFKMSIYILHYKLLWKLGFLMYFFWERKTGFSLKWSGKAGSGPFPDTYLKPPSWLLSLVQGWTLKIVIHDLHHSLGTACQGYHRPLWFSTILRGRSRQSVHIAGLLPLIYHSC